MNIIQETDCNQIEKKAFHIFFCALLPVQFFSSGLHPFFLHLGGHTDIHFLSWWWKEGNINFSGCTKRIWRMKFCCAIRHASRDTEFISLWCEKHLSLYSNFENWTCYSEAKTKQFSIRIPFYSLKEFGLFKICIS